MHNINGIEFDAHKISLLKITIKKKGEYYEKIIFNPRRSAIN